MFGATNKRRLWVVAPALILAGGLRAVAGGDDVRRAYPAVAPRQGCGEPCRYIWVPPLYEKRSRNVWIPPKYETVERKVWREPVYEERQVLVDVPPVKEWRRVAQYDACGRYMGERWVECLVRPGGKRWETQRVLVKPGCWETVCEQVLVCPGRWETVCEDVLVREGHWKLVCGDRVVPLIDDLRDFRREHPVPLIDDLRNFRRDQPVNLLDDLRRFNPPRGQSYYDERGRGRTDGWGDNRSGAPRYDRDGFDHRGNDRGQFDGRNEDLWWRDRDNGTWSKAADRR